MAKGCAGIVLGLLDGVQALPESGAELSPDPDFQAAPGTGSHR